MPVLLSTGNYSAIKYYYHFPVAITEFANTLFTKLYEICFETLYNLQSAKQP